MRCAEVSELMSLKLDGLATDDDHAGLNAHLAECADCRLAWSALQEVSSLLASATWLEPPADFTRRVMARVEQRHTPRTIAGAVLLMAASVLVSSLALLPMVALATLVWDMVRQTSVVADGLRTVNDLIYAGGTLLGVVVRLAGTLVESVPAPVLMLYPLMAILLALAWVLALARARAGSAPGGQDFV